MSLDPLGIAVMRCGRIGQIGHGGNMPEIWDCRKTHRKTHRRGRRERREKKETTFFNWAVGVSWCFVVFRGSTIAPEWLCDRAWTWSRLAFQRRSRRQDAGVGLPFCVVRTCTAKKKSKKAERTPSPLTLSNNAESQGGDDVLTASNIAKSQGSDHVLTASNSAGSLGSHSVMQSVFGLPQFRFSP